MNRYFTTNVLRMFQNRKIYICTLGMALTLYMSGIAFIRSDGDSANLQDAFSVVSSSGFIILFYLLCVIGGGLSYCEDCNSGFTRYAVVRGDAKKYIRGHLFSAALGGCASMLGGMALYELLMIFTLWPIKGSFYAMFSQNHAYFIQNIWNALLLSLLGAVLAGLAMTVTACIPNIFVGTAMPILIYYMVICLNMLRWSWDQFCRHGYTLAMRNFWGEESGRCFMLWRIQAVSTLFCGRLRQGRL